MSRRCVKWMTLCLALGCGPDPIGDETGSTGGSGGSAGSSTGGEPEVSAFEELDAEYLACGRPEAPACVNLECAVDEMSVKYVTMIVEEIEKAGVADRVRVSSAGKYNPAANQFPYQIQTQVEWYRFWSPEDIRTTDTDAEVRAKIQKRIALIAEKIPTSIIDRAEVAALTSACDGMVYSVCDHNVSQTGVRILRETGDPCAGGRTDTVSVNIVTGEDICELNAPTSCGAAQGMNK